jgi:hypothetical protein
MGATGTAVPILVARPIEARETIGRGGTPAFDSLEIVTVMTDLGI